VRPAEVFTGPSGWAHPGALRTSESDLQGGRLAAAKEGITETTPMKQPENQSTSYTTLFSAVDEGTIKIPQFQRDFVWDKSQTARLI